MATLVLGAVGTAIGGSIGGAILGVSAATIGGFVGSALGSVVDSWIVSSLTPAQRIEGARLESLRITSSTEGAVIPRLYGRMRIGGNIIWATDFRERKKTTTQGGGKGGGGQKVKTTEYLYYASFAVALCEGPITGIGRIWADGKLLDTSGITWRWYPGDEVQSADPLIATTMGADETPAYRGTAYVVFEDLALGNFGNRLPQLSFEVFRPLGGEDGAESLIRAVTLIPSAGEFVYATTPIRKGGSGTTISENVHARSDATDLTVALDQLQAALPNLESVSLVVSWFGTDLRAGNCQIRPCVEVGDKATTPLAWRVNGLDRASAPTVSVDGSGRPVYGGTPADFSLVEAIREIRARGWRVTFYPFLLMDVPSGNSLPDPYSDNAGTLGQPAFPWRGRITCSPAVGYDGTVDQTTAAESQVAAFFGSAAPSDFSLSGEAVSWTGGTDWGLRRMILHYAHLCAAAGGVDGFLIGSELRGLTTIRAEGNSFPAVQALRDLASDVRGILGPSTRISYAADWSEYFGYHVTEAGGSAPADFSDIELSAAITAGDYKVFVGQLAPDFANWRLHVYSSGTAIDLGDVSLGASISQTGPDSKATYYAIRDIWIGDVPLGTTLTYSDIMTIQQGTSSSICNDILFLYGLDQGDIDSAQPDGLRMASFASVVASRNTTATAPGSYPRSLSHTRTDPAIVALRIVVQLEEPYLSGAYDKVVTYSSPELPLATTEPVTSVFYHLDPLWGDPEIDFVGIDNYMPLSDWRDGRDHADALNGWPSVYDRAYLQANIEGGEGYDWFYATEADRGDQARSPIEDGYGKAWVFRYKDLRNWWVNEHYDRPGGMESATSTVWVPQSKPIVFTEFGCPAIDRGTNLPNVFYDPKSSESAVPYFSRGWRDDAIQRAYFEATLLCWGDIANNPVSAVYGAPMIDLGECAAWTWDARPYPHFPELTHVWADGPNWARGHWLTGRLGAGSLSALVRDLCLRAGLPASRIDTSGLTGSVEGYIITALESPPAWRWTPAASKRCDRTSTVSRSRSGPPAAPR
nr:glycoside hydrolase TIM-barrel-like domain-containing protein [Thetidibacter halocola]